MQGLPRLTINQLHRLLNSGLITSEQLSTYCYTLAVAGEDLWNLHAFERLAPPEDVLENARRSDERRLQGKSLSVLDGIPVSIKANIAVENMPLTAGSRILGAGSTLDTQVNVGYNADVSRCLLQDCGAVFLGSTTQDEFGMGSLGINVVAAPSEEYITGTVQQQQRPTKNPLWLLQQLGGRHLQSDQDAAKYIQQPREAIVEAHANALVPEKEKELPHMSAGGSSCGSAASVAHGSSIVSLGSDTGGSVRLPAAWCGVVGLKPTYGLVSRNGLVNYASSLDTVGILAPSAGCAATVLDKFARQESSRDSTRSSKPLGALQDSEASLEGLKVGIPAAFSVTETPDRIRDAWLQAAQVLESKGARVEIVSDERLASDVLQRSLAAYYIVAVAEASSNLARYDGFRYGPSAIKDSTDINYDANSALSLLEQQYATTRTQGFGNEVVRRILCGTSVLSSDKFHSYYEAGAKLRAVLTKQLHDTLSDFDVLLVPTAVFKPPIVTDNIDQTEILANDVMTVPFSMAGLPAISVPYCKWDESCPSRIGLQLVSHRHGEHQVLRAAMALEEDQSV